MSEIVITSEDIEGAAKLHNNQDRVSQLTSKDTFLLLLWPSWVGKSTIIRQLWETKYIWPYTTRELRHWETDKKHVSDEEYDNLNRQWQILFSNQLYWVRYGTPLAPVLDAQSEWRIPVLDFPLDKVATFADSVKRIINLNFLCIYLFPPDISTWIQRMQSDGRVNDSRLSAGKAELESLVLLHSPHPLIDASFVSRTGEIGELTTSIRKIIQSLNP